MDKKDYEKEQCRYYEEFRQRQMMQGGCGSVMMIAFVVMIMAMLTSCKTVEYVPVIEHQTDTLIQTNIQRDSIYVHDSISVMQKGDTVQIDRWHTKYVEKQVHDTTYVSKIDSIPQPYPVEVEVEVEKQLTWWQNFKIHLGGIILWLLLLVAVVCGVRWYLKLTKGID